ncbi:MAG TPA: aminotransferase class I/II-fold pyridoxal phosphate-dependent enzyme [Bacteroidales bacterium]|jgi:cystathionine beta-lyase|nr:aminotransferase class I/II-fold pyridoxal phosphate-dependent enzyme [Bacteroidales bacterium]
MKDISYIINQLGEEREKYFNAVTPPVFQTSNFAFRNVEDLRKSLRDERHSLLYSRGNNPTIDILCKKLAALEDTEEALAFASGMAAISAAVISFVKSGDHIVSVKNNYSWTNYLMTRFLPRFGVETTFVDGRFIENFKKAIRKNTRLIYLESPNSLTFELQDIEAVARLAKENGILTLTDNSYASPLTQSPANMGVDVILHSASKYLGGHSDIVAGVVCGSAENIGRIFENEYLGLGGIISPFNAWLMLRGLRTLQARIDRIAETTAKVLEYLEKEPMVTEVLHPLSPGHPQYELAVKQMLKPAGLFSVRLDVRDREQTELFVNSLRLFIIGVSWGGHESLVFPAVAFDEKRTKEGYTNNLVRFYIGLDEPGSLIEDLRQAFDRIRRS